MLGTTVILLSVLGMAWGAFRPPRMNRFHAAMGQNQAMGFGPMMGQAPGFGMGGFAPQGNFGGFGPGFGGPMRTGGGGVGGGGGGGGFGQQMPFGMQQGGFGPF